MTGPDYNALQPERNDYNRQVGPLQDIGIDLQE